MKTLILALVLFMPGALLAAGGNVHLESADIDLTDEAALLRGAKYFVNY